LHLFDVGHVKKNRISELQILFSDTVKGLVKAWAQPVICRSISGIWGKSVCNVVIVEVYGRNVTQDFSR